MMKNNIELFIKYLEDDLSNGEKNAFEKRFDDDAEFQSEFYSFSKMYYSSKEEVEIDERYFTTLIPKARKRAEQSKSSVYMKFAYLLPIIIIAMFITFSDKNENISDFELLLQNFTEDEYLKEDLLSSIYETESLSSLDNELLYEFYSDELNYDETVFEYLEEKIVSNEINNELLNQLSESEFNSIYDELTNKKNIIGER